MGQAELGVGAGKVCAYQVLHIYFGVSEVIIESDVNTLTTADHQFRRRHHI